MIKIFADENRKLKLTVKLFLKNSYYNKRSQIIFH